MTEPSIPPPVPRWLRGWAVVTVLAALPLALLGAETTTKGVGMADQVSLRTPWYFFTLDLRETPLGLLIEHSHRLFGWTVGACCIVLALGLQFTARGRFRWLGWVALLIVSAQGIFGILRVRWNALAGPELAAFHGCFAQLALATLVAIAVMLSSTFWSTTSAARRVFGSAIGLCFVVYLQIVFGAIVRHLVDSNLLNGLAQRIHVLLAIAIVVKVVWMVGRLRGLDDRAAWRVALLLLVLIVLQPILGVEAWIRRFGAGTLPALVPPSSLLDFVRSAHHILGTAIFSTAVALSVLLSRNSTSEAVTIPGPRPLEGAA